MNHNETKKKKRKGKRHLFHDHDGKPKRREIHISPGLAPGFKADVFRSTVKFLVTDFSFNMSCYTLLFHSLRHSEIAFGASLVL